MLSVQSRLLVAMCCALVACGCAQSATERAGSRKAGVVSDERVGDGLAAEPWTLVYCEADEHAGRHAPGVISYSSVLVIWSDGLRAYVGREGPDWALSVWVSRATPRELALVREAIAASRILASDGAAIGQGYGLSEMVLGRRGTWCRVRWDEQLLQPGLGAVEDSFADWATDWIRLRESLRSAGSQRVVRVDPDSDGPDDADGADVAAVKERCRTPWYMWLHPAYGPSSVAAPPAGPSR